MVDSPNHCLTPTCATPVILGPASRGLPGIHYALRLVFSCSLTSVEFNRPIGMQTEPADDQLHGWINRCSQRPGGNVSSTYLVCVQDQGTPAQLQREYAGRANSVVGLDAGYHPFLSQPAAGRDLVL